MSCRHFVATAFMASALFAILIWGHRSAQARQASAVHVEVSECSTPTQGTPTKYNVEAVANLSNWRSFLMERTLRESAHTATQRSVLGNTVTADQPHSPDGQVCPELMLFPY